MIMKMSSPGLLSEVGYSQLEWEVLVVVNGFRTAVSLRYDLCA